MPLDIIHLPLNKINTYIRMRHTGYSGRTKIAYHSETHRLQHRHHRRHPSRSPNNSDFPVDKRRSRSCSRSGPTPASLFSPHLRQINDPYARREREPFLHARARIYRGIRTQQYTRGAKARKKISSIINIQGWVLHYTYIYTVAGWRAGGMMMVVTGEYFQNFEFRVSKGPVYI